MASNPWLLAAALGLLVAAAVCDFVKREIPHVVYLGVALFALADAGLGSGLAYSGWKAAAAILAVGFFLSVVIPVVGAGDVKLLAAVALWLPGRALELLLLIAWAGGILALLVLLSGVVTRHRTASLPYGVAISLPACLMLTKLV